MRNLWKENTASTSVEEDGAEMVEIEIEEEVVHEEIQPAAVLLQTVDKSIQVTPSIIDELKKITLTDMIQSNRDLNAFTAINSSNLMEKIVFAASKLELGKCDRHNSLHRTKGHFSFCETKNKFNMSLPISIIWCFTEHM